MKRTLAGLADKRTGDNTQYSMETIGLSAFSVFFTQSPSFLAHQKTMEQNKGQSNAQTLFQVDTTPSDNHIATLPTRETFFQHVRALTTYMRFSSWENLRDFMMRGLEIGPYTPQDA